MNVIVTKLNEWQWIQEYLVEWRRAYIMNLLGSSLCHINFYNQFSFHLLKSFLLMNVLKRLLLITVLFKGRVMLYRLLLKQSFFNLMYVHLMVKDPRSPDLRMFSALFKDICNIICQRSQDTNFSGDLNVACCCVMTLVPPMTLWRFLRIVLLTYLFLTLRDLLLFSNRYHYLLSHAFALVSSFSVIFGFYFLNCVVLLTEFM